jgi:hypothetical protein
MAFSSRFPFFAFAMLPLCGCVVNDHFADRAVQYNLEAEQIQDQGLLLNILRASKRRPLEFTSLTSVSGSGAVQGQIGLSLPFSLNGAKTASTITPSLTIPNGPSYTVGVVDTQEFYQGLLTPIDAKTIDLFLHRGLPRALLFDLFVSHIKISQKLADGSGAAIAEFSNNVQNDTDFDNYQEVVSELIKEGLTTEKTDKPKSYGPLLTAYELSTHPDTVSKAVAAGLEVKEVSLCDLSPSELKIAALHLGRTLHEGKPQSDFQKACEGLKNISDDSDDTNKKLKHAFEDRIGGFLSAEKLPPVLYRLEKAGGDYRLCFDSPKAAEKQGVTACGESKKSATATSGSELEGGIKISAQEQQRLCKLLKELLKEVPNNFVCGEKVPPLQLSFTTRSTYSMIYYLGEVVRKALYYDNYKGNSRGYIIVEAAKPGMAGNCTNRIANLTMLKDDTGVDYSCNPLFAVEKTSDSFVTVHYDGADYGIPKMDHASTTFEVLDLITELLALHRSAKDLPATNVLNVVGAP